MGQNQLQFDGPTKEDLEPYDTEYGAVGYVWDIVIGQQGDMGQFTASANGGHKGEFGAILWILFVGTVMILFILFLNILVAIMGNTFNTRI